MRLLFAPIGIAAGLLAGFLAQKAFNRVWALFDEEDPPEPVEREVNLPKVIAALVIQGAIFRLTRGLVDRGARKGFARMTGEWPGPKEEAA